MVAFVYITDFTNAFIPFPTNNRNYKIKKITFFNTFYGVNAPNNVITTSLGSVTITPGFYDPFTLALDLDAALKTLNTNFACTFSGVTGLLTISLNTVFTISSTPLLLQLGFTGAQSGNSTYTGQRIPEVIMKDVYLCVPGMRFILPGAPSIMDAVEYVPLITATGEIVSHGMSNPVVLTSNNPVPNFVFRSPGNVVIPLIGSTLTVEFD